MKNKCIVLLLLGSILFAGCKKFLTQIPESEYSVEGSYHSQADFQQAIAGIYSQLQVLYRGNASYFRSMIARSDEITGDGYSSLGGLNRFIDNDNNPTLSGAWNNYWIIINLSNLILDRIDGGDFIDSETQNFIKGEAYMFRAYSYWSLAWQFGGMPLIDKPSSVEETRKIPRSTQQATFDFAAEDYKKAILLLPAQWPKSYTGRATKYAAEGMLARLYMFRSDFAQAKPLLEDIIASGKYKMEPSYIHCFTDSHDNGSERIWEVQFMGGELGEGQGFSSGCLPEKFYDPDIMPFTGSSTAMLVSNDMYNSYEPGDIRRSLSLIKGYTSTTGIVDTTSKYIIKYTHYDAYTPKAQNDFANNLPILRYTDVKMMYAEILNEETYVPDGEAFHILNEIRTRADLSPLTSSDLASQQDFRNALRHERRVEFAFEGIRWADLVRWGIAKDVMNLFFQRPEEGGGRYTVKDHQLLFAIPGDEIARYNDESVMKQNPGY
jgi:hypothetical protein